MSQQATSRRRKKSKSKSPSYPLISAAAKKKRKKLRKKEKTDRIKDNDDSDETDNIDTTKKSNAYVTKNKTKKPTLYIIGTLSLLLFLIFSFFIIYIEYSKRLERRFELNKYNHQREMQQIALERAKIDAEISKLQENLKQLEYNKELIEIKQKHEMEMEAMKLRHKSEFEKLKIESERESETWTLKMQKMKSMLAESDKKLNFEQEHNQMILKHETERIKIEFENKLEEVKSIDDNKRILNELKISKSSELYSNALDALHKQVGNEKQALELKRKECFVAKKDERDSWWFTTDKYGTHAKEVCNDYQMYRNDVNKLIEHLSSLTQQRTKLIDDGPNEPSHLL